MTETFDKALSAIIAVAIVAILFFIFRGHWAVDLSATYFAARSFGLGLNDLIYLSSPEFFGETASPEWNDMVAELGFAGNAALPYVYPPLWAALLSGYATSVGPIAFYDTFLLLHAVALAASIGLAYRIVIPANISLSVWFAISCGLVVATTPFATALWLNQPQILVTFLILLGFERYRRGHWVFAGIVLGVAAAIKLTPLIFGLIFLWDRNWKAALAMALTGVLILGVSLAVAGADLHFRFLEQLGRVAENDVVTPLNFSLEGVIYRIQGMLGGLDLDMSEHRAYYVVKANSVVGGLCSIFMLAGVFFIWLMRRGLTIPQAVFPCLLGVWSLSILFGHVAWSHYMLGPLLLLPGILAVESLILAVPILIGIAAMVSHPVQQILIANKTDPLWIMCLGALSLLAMFAMALRCTWLVGGDARTKRNKSAD